MSAAMSIHRPMTSPANIKQFQEDFEIAKLALGTAMLYLRFEDQKMQADAGTQRTWMGATDCGAALKRMHDSENYRDSYPSWIALCRDLKISKTTSYRLMSCAETLAKIPPDQRAKIGILSDRQLITLAQAEPDEQSATLNDAIATGDTDAAFAALRAILKAAAETETEFDDGEVEKKKPGAVWAKRTINSLVKWFAARGMEQELGDVLDVEAAILLTEQAEAKSLVA